MPEHLNLQTFIRRNRILIAAMAIFCCVLATTVLILSPKRYLSFTSLYVMSSDDILGMFQSAIEGIGLSTGADDRQGYVLAIMHSSDVKSAVLEKLDKKLLEAFWDDTPLDERSMEESWERMDEFVRIDDATSSEPIALFVTTENPELSYALCKHYLSLVLARLDTENRSQEKFLEDRLSAARKDLADAATAFQKFQEESALPFTVEAQGQAEFAALSALYAEYAKAAVELSATEDMLQAPGDVAIQLELTAARAGHKARADLLKTMLEDQNDKLEKMPAIIRTYGMMQRDIAEKAKIVETLATQYELAKFNVAKTTTPYRIIDRPFLPQSPVRKPVIAVLVGSWIIGAILGIGISLLIENFKAQEEP